uniref:Ribulose-bisphosphate carboxylase large chain n=1 Tax=Candidatus Kentrum eta TaxID=2126337 RepID=A0A450V0T7_9GAMM|nr:MAG: ribulose-bisphosphate carboxylase large chain [Candidatus Kentron sp. H]VFJ91698.1 MAG: ribulose-bisphosphate carboxylase large chain [Candidatus Kentron sp. H]VFJ98335.1 MAG: ribulose-bisphosphate carboxylase large chain [Candidatus Kentron sp. H]
MPPTDRLQLTGERIRAVYRLTGAVGEASARAEDICVEQTVEFPKDLIDREDILGGIVGKVVSLNETGGRTVEATIAFPREAACSELTQLLNVLFGNISLKPGIRLVGLTLPDGLLSAYRGPRFGRTGLRQILDVPERPLLATALKPLGLEAKELANLAGRFALGGLDMIKDDHGLTDQPFCRFRDRVARCADAVREANVRTGGNCLYFANITAPAGELEARAYFAKTSGTGGVVIAPGLAGFDAMRALADDDALALPILSHPAFLGSFTVHPASGIAHGVLHGRINRLAGADACIFPSYGGRFSFTEAECRDIAEAVASPMGNIKTILPAPAGGMNLERVPELIRFYGNECILLIGGDLHRHEGDLVKGCRKFVDIVEKMV